MECQIQNFIYIISSCASTKHVFLRGQHFFQLNSNCKLYLVCKISGIVCRYFLYCLTAWGLTLVQRRSVAFYLSEFICDTSYYMYERISEKLNMYVNNCFLLVLSMKNFQSQQQWWAVNIVWQVRIRTLYLSIHHHPG